MLIAKLHSIQLKETSTILFPSTTYATYYYR
jgi:hypothetical protein